MNTADPAQWLTRYDERLSRTAARAKEAGALLEKVTGTASSPRRDVTVTVNASGALEDLSLTPATRSLEADELARLILDATRQARLMVSVQVNAITSEYFGEGPALAVVTQHQPAGAARRDDDDYFANPPEITT
ncbi:YbaB/EbfC family nucleoid-associated protein [Kibdelosporangium phytohabitans]|uniref:YbaB/EbfC DNA-binding family protein n=1 Tax=Kibdelosporangium phytohabitans TaxID=860235 RepID=A0A0N9HNQ7_9PSEU|nr:YbaB/EbfC family nucleoid-associated protein [Kibdelosporangium phytohabitans]ALG08634.1 hypothetical protein AOZ06_18450 [Kibdelosporangium phytohabitans]MBE1470273.1 DNA-binding protein YbaB [Kibdelosporangium phytohabitans]